MSAGMFHYISSVVVYLVWSESMPNMLEVFQGVGNDRDATKPRQVPELPPVVELACGGYHTGAISRNGHLYMWGSNEYGCLGFGCV
jgi:alpha-tubulin suppressor-like RCC1 family protein